MLRRGDDVALRRVADDDALLRRIGDVDVVQAGAGPADDAQVGGGVEQALVDERLAAHDDAVVGGDDLEELLVTQAVLDVDLAGRRQLGDDLLIHEFRDEHPRFRDIFQPCLHCLTRDGPRAAPPSGYLG